MWPPRATVERLAHLTLFDPLTVPLPAIEHIAPIPHYTKCIIEQCGDVLRSCRVTATATTFSSEPPIKGRCPQFTMRLTIISSKIFELQREGVDHA